METGDGERKKERESALSKVTLKVLALGMNSW